MNNRQELWSTHHLSDLRETIRATLRELTYGLLA
jgi:hypothetical protein